ncbi:MAG: hypothetical protein O3C17_13370 [Planctomycetota bacterium]|nr:hypothetical protein [Planctomycetota bacterium]
MAWSPDSRLLAISPESGDVEFWDVARRECVRTISGVGASFEGLCWSPDGKRIAVADKDEAVTIFDASSGAKERSFRFAANCLDFSRDSKRIVAGSGRRFWIWDLQTGKQLQKFKVKHKTTFYVRFAPDDQSLVVTGELTLPTGSARSVAVSRDGRTVAVAQKNNVHLFDSRTGRAAGEPYRHEQLVSSVAFSPTRDLLVSRSSDGKAQFRNSQSRALEATMDLGMSPIHMGYSVFSRDGRMLALVSPDKSTVDLVDAATRKRVRKIQIHEALISLFLPVCFLPDNKELALLAVSPDPEDETRVLYHIDLQDLSSGVLQRRLQGAFQYPSAIACPPQGDVIAVADETVSPRKHCVRVYSTATGKLLAQFDGHVDRIRQLTFSPDGSRLFSTSQDTTPLIWDLEKVRAGVARNVPLDRTDVYFVGRVQ